MRLRKSHAVTNSEKRHSKQGVGPCSDKLASFLPFTINIVWLIHQFSLNTANQ